jgi:transposase-like protein
MEEGIEEGIEKGIEEGIEKGIEEGIKEVVEQIMEEIVEEVNMEKDTGDPPKFRRNSRDRKQTKKSLTYYRDLREMKDKRSGYEKGHRI